MRSDHDETQQHEPMRGDAENERLKRRVRQLEGQLAEMDRQRIEYLQNVSHQLVAPLNALKWHVENITNARMGVDRAQKALRSIYSQATIAVHLAKNFVFMSNLEGDHSLADLREALEPISLERLIVNLADDFQPLGWHRNIQIEVDPASFREIPDVIGMKPLLSQVFSNLIENALKYSAEGTTITVTGKPSTDNSDSATVCVTNCGIGILPEDEANLWGRGFRGEEARNKHPSGTGFGLYIAKKIVELHEGAIEGFTDAKERTHFVVTLRIRGLEGKARQWPRKPS